MYILLQKSITVLTNNVAWYSVIIQFLYRSVLHPGVQLNVS